MIVSLGRFLEYRLVGQADFRIRVPFADTRTIETDLEGKLQLDAVVKKLEVNFRIVLKKPVLLEVKAPPPLGWKGSYYHSEGNLGRYEAHKLGHELSHKITVRPGLPTPVFRAILAHELVHAWQTEQKILVGNGALREGMARWVEYHFLQDTHPEQAQKLLNVRHFTFGKAIGTILKYEDQHGRDATLDWLRETG